MNIAALRTLVAIARDGSFSRVAEQSNTTLSAVSTRMKALEAELGASLFDRSTRPPTLTPHGRAVAREAARAVAAHDAVLHAGTGRDILAGEFRLGFVASAYVRFMPALLQKRPPNARFDCRSGLSRDLYEDVRAHRLDAAVLTRSLDDPAFCERLIARERMVIAAPLSHAHDPTDAIAEALPFIHFMPSTGIGTLIARSAPRRAGRRDTIVLDSIEASVECVAQGIGYAVLPGPDVERTGKARVHTRPAPNDLTRDLVLVTRAADEERCIALAALFESA